MVTIDSIKLLRERTNAPMMDCKNALKEANGDITKALDILKKRGQIVALKKALRSAKEGRIESYIHSNGKIGVLVEIDCETDFVARNEEFKRFARDIAMQIAACSPIYLNREAIPKEVIEKEKELLKEGIKDKPSQVVEKIAQGKLEKFYSEACLMDQNFIKDEKTTIKEYLESLIGKIGENILIRRFIRFQVGEEL